MSFARQKAKTFLGVLPLDPPPGLCHGPAGVFTALPRPTAAFQATRVSCSYNLGSFGTTDVDFFFCIKGCVRYIFASLFLSLNESTCQTGKNLFYFTSKALFLLNKIKF